MPGKEDWSEYGIFNQNVDGTYWDYTVAGRELMSEYENLLHHEHMETANTLTDLMAQQIALNQVKTFAEKGRFNFDVKKALETGIDENFIEEDMSGAVYEQPDIPNSSVLIDYEKSVIEQPQYVLDILKKEFAKRGDNNIFRKYAKKFKDVTTMNMYTDDDGLKKLNIKESAERVLEFNKIFKSKDVKDKDNPGYIVDGSQIYWRVSDFFKKVATLEDLELDAKPDHITLDRWTNFFR